MPRPKTNPPPVPVPDGRRASRRGNRTPEWVRQACRDSMERLLIEVNRRLDTVPERKKMTLEEIFMAIDKLGKYGVGTTHRVNPNDLSDEQIIRLLNADAA